ncbi:MAG TPA: secretin N-terminal domain-containing protein [Gemmatimonadales bacterium]|jgi:general secretion pathway protein D|nr:secretin N-terminal domain-containing protein [Gemmatimonadales bacterium]
MNLTPIAFAVLSGALVALSPVPAVGQDTTAIRESAESLSIRFVESDLRAVIQTLGRYLTKPILMAGVPPNRVTLETPQPVTRAAARMVLRGLVESQGLAWSEDSALVRIGPKAAAEPAGPHAAVGAGPVSPDQAGDPLQLFVIRLKHARAADVAATVNLLFGGNGMFSGTAGLSGGALSEELRQQNIPPDGPPATRPVGPPARRAALSGQVTLVPDALTNSLLVRASQEDYEVIRQAVEELDIRPLQVLIEVLIVEARRDRNFTLGADLFLPPQTLDDGTIDARTQGGGIGDLVIRIMNLGKADIDAVLRTSESRGNVTIVSRPVLLASNNTEARFLVGSQRPFVQVSRSLPTDTPSRDQVVQYRDVGTKLTVLPTINHDGYVSLLIRQEINAATSEVAFDAPVISTREAVTQVLVRDGQTIVLGGLRDRQRDRSSSGVPILSGIPIIGGLFGGTSRKSSDTELYLFLTPRILRSDADADSVTAPRLPREVTP